jgi:hypothetical protein
MVMERLQAETQYGDWEGSAAADNAAVDDLGATLAARGLAPAGRFLVAFDLWQSEVDGSTKLTAHYALGNSYDEATKAMPQDGPIDLVAVDVPLSLADFLACFKRLNVTMVRAGSNLHAREFNRV